MIQLSREQNLDSFGRIQIAEPHVIFYGTSTRDEAPLFFTSSTQGSGTVTPNFSSGRPSVTLAIGTASGAFAKRRTREHFHYRPGHAQQIMITGVFGAPKANVKRLIGYGDEANGVFLEITGQGLAFVVRSSVSGSLVEDRVYQADWNIDPLDGNGPSDIAVDTSKAQFLYFDLQWLSVGVVRCGFSLGNGVIFAHVFQYTNATDGPYMQTASLPIWTSIENTGTAASASELDFICCAVLSGSGHNPRKFNRGISRTALVTVTTTFYPALSIRLDPAEYWRAAQLLSASVVVNTADIVLVQVVKNATLTGPTNFQNVGANSFMQYDIASTAMSGGETIYAEPVSSQNRSANLPLDPSTRFGSDFSGVATDIYTLAVRTRTGNADVLGSINWAEFI